MDTDRNSGPQHRHNRRNREESRREGPVFNIPPVLWVIIVPSVAVFGALETFLSGRKRDLIAELGVVPASLMTPAGPVLNGEFFALFTYVFVHGGGAHLFFNMVWLVVFGSLVARRLVAVGPVWALQNWQGTGRFLAFFWIGGAVSALGYCLIHATSFAVLVGASGAISAMMGAAMRFGLRRHQPHGPFSGELSPLTDKSFLGFSAVYIAVNLLPLLGFSFGDLFSASTAGSETMLAWEAHLIGYVFGALFLPVLDRMAQEDRFAYILEHGPPSYGNTTGT